MSKSNTMEPEVTLESVLEARNPKRAWKAVKANAGAACVAGRDIQQTNRHLKAHWEGIAQKLKTGDMGTASARDRRRTQDELEELH